MRPPISTSTFHYLSPHLYFCWSSQDAIAHYHNHPPAFIVNSLTAPLRSKTFSKGWSTPVISTSLAHSRTLQHLSVWPPFPRSSDRHSFHKQHREPPSCPSSEHLHPSPAELNTIERPVLFKTHSYLGTFLASLLSSWLVFLLQSPSLAPNCWNNTELPFMLSLGLVFEQQADLRLPPRSLTRISKSSQA